jgi:puromycin-sensitive aminopeptidase
LTSGADEYRLPRTVVPSRYELVLAPDLGRFTFTGEERVEVEVVEAIDTVVLNAIELDITSAALVQGDRRLQASITLDEETERATLSLPEAIDPGQWVVETTFTGTLNDKLHGFYRSTYTDDSGTERVIATTQFEATDARRAFPCWDEPDFKATFAVTLVVDEGLAAISNGTVVSEEPTDDRRRRVTFAETMRMSTYLVAFVVGPLELTDPVDVDGTALRVACVPGRAHMAPFALEIGAHSLQYFTEYFGIPYPAEKLDLIALPDFAFGAMENLGAVTFRETALLVDSETGSQADHERVADVVAHEIAHMWFGDLVTMKWWNGIWLNEAFATFMELKCVDSFRPEWERWVSFATSRGSAMGTDATSATRPIEFPVVKPSDADGMFDTLTYQKGAGVVRMLEQYLGDDDFRSGIRRYMERHSYGNTETTDLWDAIEEATSEPVRSVMDSWIFQGGLPVLSVDATDDGAGITLSQRRFRYRPTPEDENVRWQVPVLLRASVGGSVETRKLILSEPTTTIDLGGKADWVVVNAGGWGFYRTRYSGELLRRLTTDATADLDAIERFNLVSDTWHSVLAGMSPVADFVELITPMAGETDPSVWSAMAAPLGLLRRMLPEEQRAGLQAFVRRLARPAFERVGWEAQPGEPEKTATLRGLLVLALGVTAEDDEVRNRAVELHASYLEDRTSVDPDLVEAVTYISARNGGEAEYQHFLDRFREPATPQEQVRYLYGLGRFRNEGLLRRTLDMAVSGEVRTQNAPYLISQVLDNPNGGSLAWDFVEQHWDDLLERFPENSHARMLETIPSLVSPELAGRVRAFLEAHPLRTGQRTVEQTLERLDVNVALMQREGAQLPSLFDTSA